MIIILFQLTISCINVVGALSRAYAYSGSDCLYIKNTFFYDIVGNDNVITCSTSASITVFGITFSNCGYMNKALMYFVNGYGYNITRVCAYRPPNASTIIYASPYSSYYVNINLTTPELISSTLLTKPFNLRTNVIMNNINLSGHGEVGNYENYEYGILYISSATSSTLSFNTFYKIHGHAQPQTYINSNSLSITYLNYADVLTWQGKRSIEINTQAATIVNSYFVGNVNYDNGVLFYITGTCTFTGCFIYIDSSLTEHAKSIGVSQSSFTNLPQFQTQTIPFLEQLYCVPQIIWSFSETPMPTRPSDCPIIPKKANPISIRKIIGVLSLLPSVLLHYE